MSNQFDEEDEQEEKAEAQIPTITHVGPNGKRQRTKLPRHVIGDRDPTCPVCILSDERREVVQTAYTSGVSLPSIVEGLPDYKLTNVWIKAHAKRFYWDLERSRKTDRALQILQDRGLKYVKSNKDSVNAETLLKVTQWIDRREGRIVDKQETTNNVAVVFQAQPPKITPAKNALPEVTSGKKPLTLAPVSIEVLDAPAESPETVQATGNGSGPAADPEQ